MIIFKRFISFSYRYVLYIIKLLKYFLSHSKLSFIKIFASNDVFQKTTAIYFQI